MGFFVMSLAVSTTVLVSSLVSPRSLAQSVPPAPDVAAEKRASAQDIMTSAYSKVEIRHGLKLKMNGESLTNLTPRMEVRPIIGTRLINGRLDLSATFGVIKDAESAEFKQRNPELIAEFSAYSGDHLSVTPYLDLNTPFAGRGTTGQLALNTALKSRDFTSRAGTLSFTGSVEPGIETASRPGFAPVDNQVGRPGSEIGLVYNEETKLDETVKREPKLINEIVAAVSFKPSRFNGVTASLSAFVDTEWMPKYKAVAAVDSESGVEVREDGYSVTNSTFNRLRLTWAVNDRVLFINDTLQYIDGVYAKRVDGKRWENVARLSYTMF